MRQLLSPMITTTIDTSWFKDAKCAGQTQFFYEDDETGLLDDPEKARSICRSCPVCVQCLDAALFYRDSHGMWGSFLGVERKSIRLRWTKASKRLFEQLTPAINELASELSCR